MERKEGPYANEARRDLSQWPTNSEPYIISHGRRDDVQLTHSRRSGETRHS